MVIVCYGSLNNHRSETSRTRKKLDRMDDVLNDLKKAPSESDDTEHLISEEIHWLVKIFRKFCCYL